MSKRRLDDGDLVNLLRQKHKQDPEQKQQAARHTFAMLMRAQQPSAMTLSTTGPSYQYFNNNHPVQPAASCYKCPSTVVYDTCHHCEHRLCQNCLQQCSLCQHVYCSTCSNIDYSQSTEQVFCLSCAQG